MSLTEELLAKKTLWTEYKLKANGILKSYQCELVYQHKNLRVLSFVMPTGSTSFKTTISIPEGTISYGYFWLQRPYNIYRMKHNDEIIAHRFDAISDLYYTSDSVYYRDLVLDWWLTPNGELIEEDRKELQNMLETKQITHEDAAKAERTGKIIGKNKQRIMRELKSIEEKAEL